MRTTPNKSEAKPAPAKPANTKPPEIASASVPDTLAALRDNLDTGLTRTEMSPAKAAAVGSLGSSGWAFWSPW